ncbi:hypothetical protein OE131_30130 (plasmid) [Klebsiella pneumoniae]|uniref:hypothetical protein n=1 Tax=Klebsiella pneumoniae TaxID=573 RepID=UPI0021E0DAC5|nr:hypothetical protein [Klebsiella pneumoniae]UYD13822.1 hypothetical protein OE131_30130 [Klebsiella pneumoniae]
MSKQDARLYAEAVCDVIGHGKANAAVLLCVETAAAETLLGDYKDPTPTSAGTGLTQVDLGTFEWLRDKYKNSRYAPVLLNQLGIDLSRTVYAELRTSPLMRCCFAACAIWRFQSRFGDSRGPRRYWKKYYNTSAGKGTPQEDYIDKCQRAGVDALFTQ